MKLYCTINEDINQPPLDEGSRWRDNNPKHGNRSGYYDDDGKFHVCNPEDLNDREKFIQALGHNRVARFAYRYGIDSDFLYDPKRDRGADYAKRMRADFISSPSKYNRYDKLWIDDIADKPVMARLRVSGHPFVYGAWAQKNNDCDCALNIMLPDRNGRLSDTDRDYWYDYRCDHQIIALTFKYDMFNPTKEAEDYVNQLMRDIQTGKQPHVSLAEIKAKVDPTAKMEKSPMFNLRNFNYKQSPNGTRVGQRVPWKHEEELAKVQKKEVAQSNSPLKTIKMSDVNRALDDANPTFVTIEGKDDGVSYEYLVVPIGNFSYLYDMDNDKAYYYRKGNVNFLNTASKRKNLEVNNT